MLEVKTGQRCMVDLDVHLDFFGQSESFEKRKNSSCIAIVLMLGGLKRLGLDHDVLLKPDAMLVFDHHGEDRP